MKYVLIGGYADIDENGNMINTTFEDCVGITESIEEAYGMAYLFISAAIKDSDQEGETVTINPPMYNSENEDMFIVTASNNQKNFRDFVKVFALKDSSVKDSTDRYTHRWGAKEDN